MAKPFLFAALAVALTACGEQARRSTRYLTPIPPQTLALLAEKGMSPSDPILMRAYKKDSELEVWKRRADGKYADLKTYPICRWSGQLGPKIREGDRQAPEGFYTVTPEQMNPNSAYYLSFDTGYPMGLHPGMNPACMRAPRVTCTSKVRSKTSRMRRSAR
jgi:murein L,D-transpeptidase YafK